MITPNFVQIAASRVEGGWAIVFALDSAGRVYEYDFGESAWNALSEERHFHDTEAPPQETP